MDILSRVAVRVPCPHCAEPYVVPLRDVLLSHQIMHQGCPAPEETECPPVFQTRLFSEAAIKAFDQAWRRLEERAKADGGELTLLQTGNAPAAGRPRRSSAAEKGRGGRRAA